MPPSLLSIVRAFTISQCILSFLDLQQTFGIIITPNDVPSPVPSPVPTILPSGNTPSAYNPPVLSPQCCNGTFDVYGSVSQVLSENANEATRKRFSPYRGPVSIHQEYSICLSDDLVGPHYTIEKSLFVPTLTSVTVNGIAVLPSTLPYYVRMQLEKNRKIISPLNIRKRDCTFVEEQVYNLIGLDLDTDASATKQVYLNFANNTYNLSAGFTTSSYGGNQQPGVTVTFLIKNGRIVKPNDDVPSPVPSPVPTILPSGNTPSPEMLQGCVDSFFTFRMKKPNGKRTWATCDWVAGKMKHCGKSGVVKTCPGACKSCDVCADSPYTFEVNRNGKMKKRNCDWVKEKTERCGIDGASEACRETCGLCSK